MEKIDAVKNGPVNKEFFHGIIDSMSAAGILVDRERFIRYCNSAAERIFGYSKDEMIGRKTESLYGDRRIDKSNKNEIRDWLSSHGYHIGSASGTRKDGESVPLSLYTFIVKENSGAVVVIRHDSRMSRAEAFAGVYELLQDIMDTIPDMIYVKDIKNRFVLVNKAHAAALGLEPAAIIGKTDLDLFPKELAEKYDADDNEILRTGKPVLDKITSAPRPDGGITYVSTTKAPRYDRSGRIIGTIGITRNVTERVAAEEEVRRYKENLERMVAERTGELEEEQKKLMKMYSIKSEFTSVVSHELRTPISVIKESISIVLDGLVGSINERQKDLLASASDNIERLTRLVNDLLDFSKLENKKMEFRTVEGNVNEHIEQVLRSYEPLLEKKGIGLYREMDPFIPLASFDPDRINQVLYNLLNNSVKFTEKGSIKVGSRRGDGHVVVFVEDTGIGIKKEELHRLFEKFGQLGSAESRKYGGTGLGLAISKQIVEQLGGRIWAESEHGKGARFIFTLPLKKDPAK